MVQAIKTALKLVSGTAFDGFILSQLDPSPNATSDSELEAFAREQTTTVYHPAGTVRMGNCSETSVLTGQLLVRGTVGLRVVDASVFVSLFVTRRYVIEVDTDCISSPSFLPLIHRPSYME